MDIEKLVNILLPIGTASRYIAILEGKGAMHVPTQQISWHSCPAWPPDLFAVAATIIDRSCCYTLVEQTLGSTDRHIIYLNEVTRMAEQWTELGKVPRSIEKLWHALVTKHGKASIDAVSEQQEICQILFRLFAIADEACRGMGWTASTSDATSHRKDTDTVTIADFARSSLLLEGSISRKPRTMILPNVPFSLCSLVPSDTAIVLPKSMTATVGCTIRSLSHHLALLPAQTQVLPSWRMADRDYESDGEQMRLLLVPYPFHIPEDSFRLSREPKALVDGATTPGYFSLDQKWLCDEKGAELTGQKFVDELLSPLLLKARAESRGKIHGILMPECALSSALANEVAHALAEHDIEFFITGALEKKAFCKTKNIALTYVMTDDKGKHGLLYGEQSKQHRWLLDQTQITRYALNFPSESTLSARDRAKQWWEDIDISMRKMPFYAVRPDLSLSVLICEDMARNDHAMNVIRSVGPNLVVALLMDGSQLSVRWPAHYATVLSDDPGSSVLSLSCAAMVDRSNWSESHPVRSVGLWCDSGKGTHELNLPQGCYGMLLKLKSGEETQYTLDSRSDKNSTKKLTFEAAIPLALDKPVPWL
ncbi:MAG: hypothetical protein K0R08_862 [Solimicrobium sp.]|jgi:hypothetical protein|nr:hypothetical protein [Solimicrobium sp.]